MFYILCVSYSYGNSLFNLIYLFINFSSMLLLMLLSPVRDPFKEIIHAYLFTYLSSYFIRNLLLRFTYFSDDYIYYHFIVY